jgi:hypothetical protein
MEVGILVRYREQGIYEIVSQVEGSRTLFNIKDVDRGAGYSKEKRKYVGVNTPNGWHLGKNKDYGLVLTDIHKKDLETYVEPNSQYYESKNN